MTSFAALRLIAASDPQLFDHRLRQAGLQIVGRNFGDPLDKHVRLETILAVAAQVSPDVHTTNELSPIQHRLQQLAEDFGYAVALCDDLNQMSGTLPDPAHGFFKNSAKSFNRAFTDEQQADEPKSEPEEDGGDDGPPPPPK